MHAARATTSSEIPGHVSVPGMERVVEKGSWERGKRYLAPFPTALSILVYVGGACPLPTALFEEPIFELTS